ncbi:MAG: hypothetical protein JSS28_10265 [Proteobacteria bacterium]|nr:hypothetical protein [Pseudomonadota bacterium]
MNRLVPFALALALAPIAVHATEPVNPQPLVAQTLMSFNKDAARIERDMEAGGKYGYISSSEKGRVITQLGEMRKLLTEHADASDMPPDAKIALANAQGEINAILSHNDNDRLICEHVAPVGSHRPVTTCHTYAELMMQHRAMEHDMTNRLNTPQRKTGN